MPHFSVPSLLIFLLIVLVLFGRGKISDFMGDFARGIKSFKKGLQDDDEQVEEDITTIEGEKPAPAAKPKAISARKTATAARTPAASRKATTGSKTTAGRAKKK